MLHSCSHCGSSNIKKSSAAHEQGISKSSGSTRAFGVDSSGRIGISRSTSFFHRQTAVSEKNAPPVIDAARIGCFAVSSVPIIMAIGMVLNGIFGMIVAGILAIALVPLIVFIFVLSPATDEQKNADLRYAKQWYCLACGEKFKL